MQRLVALLLLSACGGSSTPVERAAVWNADDSLARRDEVRLRWYGTMDPDEDNLLVATVGLEDAHSVVVMDTGANHHFLERGVVFWLGLTPGDGPPEAVFGGSGETVHTERFGPTTLDLGTGRTLPIEVLSLPHEGILSAGLAGLFSPQRLAGTGTALLDLRARTLRFSSSANVERSGWTMLTPACPTPDGVALFVVEATIEGVDHTLIVDTGARGTSVSRGTEHAERLRPRSEREIPTATLGWSGWVPVVDDLAVEVAGFQTQADVEISPNPDGCGATGVLGSDVLRNCRILLAKDRGAMQCD